MRSPLHAAFAPIVAASLLGCATVSHGTRQRVGIASVPRGAMVTVDDTYVGTTPIVVDMPRARGHTVRLTCAGYQPYVTRVRHHPSMDGWLNLAFFPYGLVGLAVDLAGGGMYNLGPEQVAARLVRDPTAGPAAHARCAGGAADARAPSG